MDINKANLIIADHIVCLLITYICHNKAIKYGNIPVNNKNKLYMLAFELLYVCFPQEVPPSGANLRKLMILNLP